MRWLAIVFLALIAALQYPMWLGKGGWLRVRELNTQVAEQRQKNTELKTRNEALDADVRDLKQGVEAIEERARSELGMIRHDEIFFQLPGEAPTSSSQKDPAGPDSSGRRSANKVAPTFPPSRE
jgi:cell division protein FtsB